MCTNQPMNSSQYRTPDKGGIKFPSGYILVNKKWMSDTVGRELSKRTKTSYSDAMGFVDFYITEECPVIFFSESDLKTNKKVCQEKISKLNSVSSGKGVVVATWNSNVLTEFSDLQEYATLDTGLLVIPISCSSQLPAVLHKLAMEETKSPQKARKGGGPTVSEQIALLTKLPGIGEKEARILLQQFGNIVSVSGASEDELKSSLGEQLENSQVYFKVTSEVYFKSTPNIISDAFNYNEISLHLHVKKLMYKSQNCDYCLCENPAPPLKGQDYTNVHTLCRKQLHPTFAIHGGDKEKKERNTHFFCENSHSIFLL